MPSPFTFVLAMLRTALLAPDGVTGAEYAADLLTPAERAWLAAHRRIVLAVELPSSYTYGPGDYASLPSGQSHSIFPGRQVSNNYPYRNNLNWRG